MPLGSRKDVRDAVKAARGAFAGWSGRTAYNRGQILYRAAEMLEERRAEFAAALVRSTGASRARRDARSVASPSTGSSTSPAGPTRSPPSSGP